MFERRKKDYEVIVYILSSLEVYLASGINFIKAFELIKTGVKNKYYIEALDNIIKRITSGSSLAEAFRYEEVLFSSVFLDMILVAEQSGELEKVLKSMIIHFEEKLKLEKEVRNSTLYPKIILGVGAMVFIFFIDLVLPNIVGMYDGLNANLNFATRAVIQINAFLEVYNIYFLVFLLVGFIVGIKFLLKGKLKKKDLFKKVGIRKKYKELSLISILSLVMQSGVPIMYALDRLSKSVSEIYTKESIERIIESLQRGNSISDAIGEIDYMSDVSKSFFVSGENSGRLDVLILKLEKLLRNNFSRNMKVLVSKVEPISICVLGVLVLALMLLVFLPMYEYMSYV